MNLRESARTLLYINNQFTVLLRIFRKLTGSWPLFYGIYLENLLLGNAPWFEKKYLDHMLVKFEQNRVVQTIQNFVLFDKKWLTIFDKVLTPRWKTFLWLKQLFDAKILIQRLSSFSVPKFWHSDTCNRLKVAPNMADPISLNENLP